jgi:hypothetical protein
MLSKFALRFALRVADVKVDRAWLLSDLFALVVRKRSVDPDLYCLRSIATGKIYENELILGDIQGSHTLHWLRNTHAVFVLCVC